MRLMFLTMLMVRDPDHVVRLPLRVLAKKANLSADRDEAYRLAEEAVKVLEEPDERSHDNQEYQGRRLRKLEGDGGWLVLNGEKYQEQMKELWTRVRRNQKQRERRQKAKGESLSGLKGESAFTKALDNGASEEQLNRIVEESLPVVKVPGSWGASLRADPAQ